MATNSGNYSGNSHFFSKNSKLSQNDLRAIHEIFKHIVTFNFIQQISKIHNYNGNAVVNQLVIYSDELSKSGGHVDPRKENKFIQKQKSKFSSPQDIFHKMSFAEQLKGQPIIQFDDKKLEMNVKKAKPKSKKELEYERIVTLIKSGVKVVILLRGVPGSGKSYLANEIYQRTVSNCPETCSDYHIYSTDKYFELRGKFRYDSSLLSQAHEWNQKRFRDAIKMGISPIIIDNTNTQKWEMYPYIVEGMQFGYYIEILEPFTSWAYNESELTRRNVHQVPKKKIREMLDRYEPDLTGARLISIFKLQYPSNTVPPQKRLFPPLAEQDVSCQKKKRVGRQRRTCQKNISDVICTARFVRSKTSSNSSSSSGSSDEDDANNQNTKNNIEKNSKFDYLKKIIKGDNNSAWDYIILHDLESTVNNLQKSSSNEIISENSCNLKYTTNLKKSLSENSINPTTSNLYPTNELRQLMNEASVTFKIVKVKYRYSRDELLSILDKENRIKLEKRFLNESKPQRKKFARKEIECVPILNDDELNVTNRIENENENESEIKNLNELINWEPIEDTSIKWDNTNQTNKEMKNENDTKNPNLNPLPKREIRKLSILDEPIVDENIPNDILEHILPSNSKTGINPTLDSNESEQISKGDSILIDQNNRNDILERALPSISKTSSSPTSDLNEIEQVSKDDDILIDQNIPNDDFKDILPSNSNVSVSTSISTGTGISTTSEQNQATTSKFKSLIDLSGFKYFFKLLDNTNSTSTSTTHKDNSSNILKEEKSNTVEIMDSCTNTCSADFALLKNEILSTQINDDVRIIFTNNRNINEGLLLPSYNVLNVPPKILKLDKSSMTEASIEEEFTINNSSNEQFLELVSIFPSIPKKYLHDIFIHCRGNVSWAVDILLETPNNFINENVDDVEQVSNETIKEVVVPTEDFKQVENTCDLNQENVTTCSTSNVEPIASSSFTEDKKIQKHLISESNLEIKKHIEKQFVIADSHYSEHCLKIRQLRHNESQPNESLSRSSSESSLSNHESSSESDIDLDNDDDDDDDDEYECFELNLGFDFIERLDHAFGKEKINYPDGLQSVIQVPKSLACQLHLLWLESYYQQICAHEQRLEQMLKEDEEFARQLQDKENELVKSGQISSNVASIQDLINMEIDLEIAKNDSVQQNESSKDLVTKLTLLYYMFPSVSRDTINDVFETFNHRYDRTVELLTNDLDNVKSQNSFSQANISNQEKQLLEEAKKASVELSKKEETRPIIIVKNPSTKPEDKNLNFKEAEKYREIAKQEYQLRNDCLEKARVMYNRDLFLVASYYSELAQVHKTKYEKANQYAATYFVSSHTTNSENSTILDLHFLCVTEAIQVLDLFIDNHIAKLQAKKQKCIILHVITGRGLRSIDGRARVKPAVIRRLKQRHIRSNLINPGLLKFKLYHYDATTNLLSTCKKRKN